MKENIVQVKSYAFAIKIVNTFKVLQQDSKLPGTSPRGIEKKFNFDFDASVGAFKSRLSSKEFVLSRQLLRAGTSIGANIEEAIGGQSRKDFFAKLTIAYKEARETKYWIRLLTDTNYLDKETSRILLEDIEELLRIIGSIQKTIRNS